MNNIFDCIDFCQTIQNEKSVDFCENTYCFIPSFVEQISSDLFKQIIGIIDVWIKNTKSVELKGYLILFNINRKPKFCFNEFKKSLSIEVILKK